MSLRTTHILAVVGAVVRCGGDGARGTEFKSVRTAFSGLSRSSEDHQEWMTLPHPAIPHPPLDNKRRFQMAASDDLTKLADRAKEAEVRVAAAREKGKADLEADLEYARGTGEEEAKGLRETAEKGKGRISDRWEDVQEAWNQAIAKVREDVEGRKTEHDLHRAQRRADRAEDDAHFAIDFAYSAIGEAEYAVLDASLARMQADEQSEEAGKKANASV